MAAEDLSKGVPGRGTIGIRKRCGLETFQALDHKPSKIRREAGSGLDQVLPAEAFMTCLRGEVRDQVAYGSEVLGQRHAPLRIGAPLPPARLGGRKLHVVVLG